METYITPTLIIAAVAAFLTGLVVGFLGRGVADTAFRGRFGTIQYETSVWESVKVAIAAFLTIIYGSAFVLSMIDRSFQIDIEFHIIMGAIIGALFKNNVFPNANTVTQKEGSNEKTS